MSQKPAYMTEGMPAADVVEINSSEENKLKQTGVGGDRRTEPVPEFIQTVSEKVFSNANNSWIVLGRDRNAGKFSGYGGKGDTQAAAIDIVVGRMSFAPRTVDEKGDKLCVNPSFSGDAARIYISQKSDPDDYFALADGVIGNFKTRSTVSAKADTIRLVARDGGIKLVTGADSINSQGAEFNSFTGIDLIANNDDSDMQPMIKGENLVACLKGLVKHISDLNGIIDSFLMSQMMYNSALAHHFHISPYYGIPTSVSPGVPAAGAKCMMDQLSATKKSLIANKTNLVGFKMNHLDVTGKRYICSRFNNTN